MRDSNESNESNRPACPWCKTWKHVITHGESVHQFFCRRCSRIFEDQDDGEIGYGQPDKRLERQEMFRKQWSGK